MQIRPPKVIPIYLLCLDFQFKSKDMAQEIVLHERREMFFFTNMFVKPKWFPQQFQFKENFFSQQEHIEQAAAILQKSLIFAVFRNKGAKKSKISNKRHQCKNINLYKLHLFNKKKKQLNS